MAFAQQIDPTFGSPSWFHATVGQSTQKPCMKIVDLTPSLAKTMLDANFDNRSVRRAKLAQYSADMATGKWTLNGEPIIVSKDGKLNDGQHRCLAVIDANATIPVVIMFGIDRETRLTVDQGAARGAGDFLGMDGVQNASMIAAITRMVISYELNDGKGFAASNQVTSAMVRERVANDHYLAEAATFGATNHVYSRKFATGSVMGFAFYILAQVHHDDAKLFMQRVCRGDGLKMRDPAHTVREKLMAGGKSRDRKVAMIFKGWNFFRRDMKIGASSLNAELPFPALI